MKLLRGGFSRLLDALYFGDNNGVDVRVLQDSRQLFGSLFACRAQENVGRHAGVSFCVADQDDGGRRRWAG
jgi:hypothetical protein